MLNMSTLQQNMYQSIKSCKFSSKYFNRKCDEQALLYPSASLEICVWTLCFEHKIPPLLGRLLDSSDARYVPALFGRLRLSSLAFISTALHGRTFLLGPTTVRPSNKLFWKTSKDENETTYINWSSHTLKNWSINWIKDNWQINVHLGLRKC